MEKALNIVKDAEHKSMTKEYRIKAIWFCKLFAKKEVANGMRAINMSKMEFVQTVLWLTESILLVM